ncbi:MAG: glycosyltransferase family 39 protein [Candidatus Poribacteria bacterium]|nr:glycosyltransferase family 39 protein [Candidatus Poribacteria bacterium]
MQKISIGVFLFLLVVLIFLPRLLSLESHWSSDERPWMRRSLNFVSAMEKGDFAETRIVYHPGVTTTWLGGAAIWMASGRHSVAEWAKSTAFFSPENLARLRFPIAFVSGVLILIAGGLVYRLFGGWCAGVATLFFAIEPFLLAETRRVHTDVLTAEFLLLTVLLWLCYLEDETPRPRDLLFSGICFGWACLTKSHASVFLLFLPFLLFWYVKHRRLSGAKMFISALFFSAVTVFTVLCTWPYLWTVTLGDRYISPLLFWVAGGTVFWSWRKLSKHTALSRTEIILLSIGLCLMAGLLATASRLVFERMYYVLTNAHELPKLFLGKIRYNPGPLFYPVMGFVWSAPLTVPLTLVAIYGAWRQRLQAKKIFRITVALLLFGVFYCIGLSLVAKKIARYLVIFLPAVSLLSAMGAIYIRQHIEKKSLGWLFIVAVVVLQVAPVLRLHPYYATYHFPLLPAQWVAKNTTLGGGVGLEVAAAYLNAKPDAQHLQVRVSRFSGGLNEYFVGKTGRRRNSQTLEKNIDFDYDVEYVRDRQIQGTPVDAPPEEGVPSNVLQLRNALARELEHVVQLNGIDYVWIYRVLDTRANAVPAETQ